MSESAATFLAATQLTSMHHFDKRIASAMRLVAVVCVSIIAVLTVMIAVLFDPAKSAPIVSLFVFVWLLMSAYPLMLFIMIWHRTGLWWHSIDTHAGWVGISVILILLLIMILDLILPLFQGVPIYGVRIGYEPLILVILLPLIRYSIQSYTQTRADSERLQYREHWLQLAQVPMRDILFLRIPHEHA
jgi:hypothetical protein